MSEHCTAYGNPRTMSVQHRVSNKGSGGHRTWCSDEVVLANLNKLIPAIVLGVVGNSVIYLIPLLLGAMVSDRGFGEEGAGFIASVELAGYALSTFASALILDRVRWRPIVLGAVCVMIAANLGTTLVHGRELFTLVRFASGLGAGVLAAIANISVGQTDNPDRNYGLLLAASLLFGSMGLWGLPPLLSRFGLNGAYWLLGILAVLAGVTSRALEYRAAPRETGAAIGGSMRWLLVGGVLTGILLFWTEQNAVYAYMERIGNRAGLSAEFIGFGLGAANLTGFAGAALVALMGSRAGRVIPIAGSTLIQLACLATLGSRLGAVNYLLSITLIALAWNIANPFQLGILSSVDRNGKALALAATVTGAGLAAGPAAAAVMIRVAGYEGILWLAGVLAVVSLILVLPASRAARGFVVS